MKSNARYLGFMLTLVLALPLWLWMSGSSRTDAAPVGFASLAPGSLDPTFGTGGLVTTNFTGRDAVGNAVALQADGKIVVAGNASGVFALARYNSDGSLDTAFGSGGLVTTDFGYSVSGAGIVLQADGKIVVAGGGNANFVLARYNSNGSLDATFGTDFPGSIAWGNAVALQADGKIVVAGNALTNSDVDFALARFNSNGSLDTSFDGDGRVLTAFAGDDAGVNAVALQANGKIVAAGASNAGSGYDFALARYNSNGSLDTAFGSGGLVTTNFGYEAFGNAIALQADGKIVVAGTGNDDFCLARYNSNGSLDTAFGTGGKVATDFAGGYDKGNAVALQADGKIVVAGFASGDVTGADFGLVRYNSDGSLDTAFGTGGKVTTSFSSNLDRSQAVVLQADGKIVAAGVAYQSTTSAFALARYESVSLIPGIPNLLSPVDNTITTTQMITLSWQAGAGATPQGYNVQTDSGNAITVTGTTSATILSEGAHTWTVRAYNAEGHSDWAAAWSIEIRRFHIYLPLVLCNP